MASDKPDSFAVGAFEVVRKADVRAFVEKLNRLREVVDSIRLQDGVGYTVNRSTNGTTLAIRPAAGGQPEKSHPWKVTLGRENRQYHYTVDPVSYIDTGAYGPDNLNEKISLGTDRLETDYFAFFNYKVSQDLFDPREFRLKAVKKADWPGYVVPQDADQTEGNFLLATITKEGRVVQAVRNHLLMTVINYGGRAALLPVELYTGGSPDPDVPQP